MQFLFLISSDDCENKIREFLILLWVIHGQIKWFHWWPERLLLANQLLSINQLKTQAMTCDARNWTIILVHWTFMGVNTCRDHWTSLKKLNFTELSLFEVQFTSPSESSRLAKNALSHHTLIPFPETNPFLALGASNAHGSDANQTYSPLQSTSILLTCRKHGIFISLTSFQSVTTVNILKAPCNTEV